MPFSIPRFATHRLARTTAVWHVCFAKRHLSIPDLLKRLALAVRCGALGTCSALLRSGSSIESSSGTSACPAESLGSVPTSNSPALRRPLQGALWLLALPCLLHTRCVNRSSYQGKQRKQGKGKTGPRLRRRPAYLLFGGEIRRIRWRWPAAAGLRRALPGPERVSQLQALGFACARVRRRHRRWRCGVTICLG